MWWWRVLVPSRATGWVERAIERATRGHALQVALVLVLGCAQGAETRVAPRDAAAGGALDAGLPTLDAGALVPPDADGPDAGFAADAEPATDAALLDAGADGGSDVDGGTDGGVDGGTDGGVDGGVDAGTDAGFDAGPLCPTSGTCASPRALGSLDGDQGSPSLETTGLTDEWLSLTVVDNGSVWNGDRTVRVTLELESTGDARYELVTYRAASSATPLVRDCVANEAVGAVHEGRSTVALSWPDVTNGLFASDGDGRIVSVRVRHVSGPCEGGWRLVAHGNR